jgi:hypothetical protein
MILIGRKWLRPIDEFQYQITTPLMMQQQAKYLGEPSESMPKLERDFL